MSADTEKTRAIVAMQKELQDVTEAVRQIKTLLELQRAEREGWKAALYRIMKESVSLFFPEFKNKNDRPPVEKASTPTAGDGADGSARTPPHIS